MKIVKEGTLCFEVAPVCPDGGPCVRNYVVHERLLHCDFSYQVTGESEEEERRYVDSVCRPGIPGFVKELSRAVKILKIAPRRLIVELHDVHAIGSRAYEARAWTAENHSQLLE